jgi:hypothetical protein
LEVDLKGPRNIWKTLSLLLVSIKNLKWTFYSISGSDGPSHLKSPITGLLLLLAFEKKFSIFLVRFNFFGKNEKKSFFGVCEWTLKIEL